MASLVTLATAKAHLYVTDSAYDATILLKAEQASAIILDYLKHRLTSIASISVASPAVITTDGPHSLVSGATHTIAGTTTTPTIVGAHVVTVTGPTTFTVPVAVTVGQADAAGTVSSATWTDATVPGPVQACVLLMLAHLYEHRGDDAGSSFRPPSQAVWDAITTLLMRSRDPALA